MKCPTCRHTALAHSPPTPPTQRPRRTTGRPSHRLVPHPRPLCVPAPARKLVHGSRVARVRLPERGRGGRCLSYAWFAPRPIIDVLCSRHHSLRRGCHAWLRRKKLYRRRRVRCRCVPRGDRGRDRSRWGLLSTRFASPILNRRGPLCFDSGHGGGGGSGTINNELRYLVLPVRERRVRVHWYREASAGSRTVIVCEYDDRRGPGTGHAFGRTSLLVSCLLRWKHRYTDTMQRRSGCWAELGFKLQFLLPFRM